MKNILLLVHDDAGQEARLTAALDMARALEGRLTCLDVVHVPAMIDGDYYAMDATSMLLADEREREAANRRTLEARLAGEGVAWTWVDATGDMAGCITDAAGLADLIVVNGSLASSDLADMQGIVGDVIRRSRTPVLAVPDAARGFDARGCALIAWDGSDPVVTTMRACVPLLKLAGEVRIFTVDDGSVRLPAEEAAVYLALYGIHSVLTRVEERHAPADRLIGEACAEAGASYCLMGGYSHSPIAEALFGGVTRRMLAHSSLPLILGH